MPSEHRDTNLAITCQALCNTTHRQQANHIVLHTCLTHLSYYTPVFHSDLTTPSYTPVLYTTCYTPTSVLHTACLTTTSYTPVLYTMDSCLKP